MIAAKTPAAKQRKPTRKLVSSLKVSPENAELYGAIDPDDPDVIDLARSIKENGVREPIVITLDNWIVSGNRRWTACKLIGQVKVPVRVLPYKRVGNEARFKKDLRDYNRHRDKNNHQRLKEELVDADPYEPLCFSEPREPGDRVEFLEIEGRKTRSIITPVKFDMVKAVLKILKAHEPLWPVSVRFVHYRLVEAKDVLRNTDSRRRYVNDQKSYADLSNLLTRLRLDGSVSWDAIADETRTTTTWDVHQGIGPFVRGQLEGFLKGYWRDLMRSQPDYIHCIVEKNTAKKFVEQVTQEYCIPTTTGRGFSSIDPYHKLDLAYRSSGKDRFKLIVVSDFDPEGEEIVQVAARTLRDDFGISKLDLVKAGVTPAQIKKYNLPSNFDVKKTSSRYEKFVKRHGKSVHEIEALTVEALQSDLREVIDAVIDTDTYNQEVERELADKNDLNQLRLQVHAALSELDLSDE